jgi:hypothetical protein
VLTVFQLYPSSQSLTRYGVKSPLNREGLPVVSSSRGETYSNVRVPRRTSFGLCQRLFSRPRIHHLVGPKCANSLLRHGCSRYELLRVWALLFNRFRNEALEFIWPLRCDELQLRFELRDEHEFRTKTQRAMWLSQLTTDALRLRLRSLVEPTPPESGTVGSLISETDLRDRLEFEGSSEELRYLLVSEGHRYLYDDQLAYRSRWL